MLLSVKPCAIFAEYSKPLTMTKPVPSRMAQQRSRVSVFPAHGRYRLRDKKAAGQQQKGVEQPKAPVEQRLRAFEQRQFPLSRDGIGDEEDGKDDQVAANEHPYAFLARHMAARLKRCGLRSDHHSPPSASRLIAPSMAKIMRLNQMPNTTAGTQKARTPFQAKGPVLNRPMASPGRSRTPVHKFM